ncbi:MAG: beta-propeller domain-containing protein [Methanomassiliicoccales archaeon]
MKPRWKIYPRVLVVIMLLTVMVTLPLAARGATKDSVTYSMRNNTITLKWGEKPSGGYAIAINSVQRQGAYLTVYYALRSPAPGESVTTVITHPQASAAIPSGKTRIMQVRLVRQTWKAVAIPVKVNDLPAVGTAANMKKLLEDAGVGSRQIYMMDERVMKNAAAPTATGAAVADTKTENSSGDYSHTNTQVAGVDEADLIKTDGQYIYQIIENKVRIIKAYPATAMTAAATLSFEEGFYPSEIYVDGKYLVVIGSGARNYSAVNSVETKRMMFAPPYYRVNDVSRVKVYDITDHGQPKSVRDVEVSGNLVASRKIGSAVYLVTNQNIYGYPGDPGFPVPLYKDSVTGNKDINIDFKDMRYFPGCITPNYLVVAGFNIDSTAKASVESYLGAGNQVYVSPGQLYVTANYYPVGPRPLLMPARDGVMPPTPAPTNDTTRIFKFALDKGKVSYNAQGEVPGHVLNQYSMDENNGYFRVATTTENYAAVKMPSSSNGLYVLDSNLKNVGKVEGIAPGEKIYSARFLGDRAYMVTFRTVDPFYIIDLKVPTSPKILGALKIPGYSDYLHPYDANHVIGFGKDTVEMANKYEPGQTNAYYLGMKMALFDVTDVKNPKQEFVENIGDRGTDSELLHNPRALLFSKEKNLIAFPVSLHQIEGSQVDQSGNFPTYGAFTWQGAYVYGLDLKQGFKLQAKITHMNSDDYMKSGYNGYDYRKMVQRIIYIKDTLYTLSPSLIKANDLNGFKEITTFNY